MTIRPLILAGLLTACDGAPPAPIQQSEDALACSPAAGATVQIAAAKLYVEYNATDNDIGVHGAFDDHGYSQLCVYDPGGVQVLAFRPRAQMEDLAMGGIFFESREPPISEFSIEDLKTTFPEGEYQVRGTTFDGRSLGGAATFTHDIPNPPRITAPIERAVVPTAGLVVTWDEVTETIDGDPAAITAYEVIITKESAPEDPHGWSVPIFDVHVGPDRRSLTVPDEFLDPASEYELEVLALEVSGNQTIAVSFFETE